MKILCHPEFNTHVLQRVKHSYSTISLMKFLFFVICLLPFAAQAQWSFNYTANNNTTSVTITSSGTGETIASSVLTVTGNKEVVDWIKIELRDKLDVTSVLKTRSALLLRDGTIVDVDGVAYVSFYSLPADNYYVAISHRNHLGVRT